MKLRRIEKEDQALLLKWLDKENICRWFGDRDFWLEEFLYEPKSSFLCIFKEEAIGFCRYTRQIPEEYPLQAKKVLLAESKGFAGINSKENRENIEIAKITNKAAYLQSKYVKEKFFISLLAREAYHSKSVIFEEDTLFLDSIVSTFCKQNVQSKENIDFLKGIASFDVEDKRQAFSEGNIEKLERAPICFLDYAICEERFLGKKLGSRMLVLLMKEAAKEGFAAFFASSSRKNIPSCHTLTNQGFTYLECLELFAYNNTENSN